MSIDSLELNGLAAIVTGSSSGIGRRSLWSWRPPAPLWPCIARSSHAAATAVSDQIRELGRETSVVLADLAEEKSQDALLQWAWSWRGGVDIWINNAGFDALTGEPAGWSFEQKLEQLWRVDVAATVRLSRGVGHLMKERGRGVIVNMGWDQVEHGMAARVRAICDHQRRRRSLYAQPGPISGAASPRQLPGAGWIKTAWGEQASGYWQTEPSRNVCWSAGDRPKMWPAWRGFWFHPRRALLPGRPSQSTVAFGGDDRRCRASISIL